MRLLSVSVLACALGCASLNSGNGEAGPGPACGIGSDGTNGSAVGVVIGRITDGADGLPIDGARVVVEGTGCAAISREDGGFRIANVPSGTHTVVVRVVGYEPHSVTDVQVKSGHTTEVDLILTHWSEMP